MFGSDIKLPFEYPYRLFESDNPFPLRGPSEFKIILPAAVLDVRTQVVMSQDFYCQQMKWSECIVRDWWRGKLSSGRMDVFDDDSCVKIPEYIRLCLSWVTGADARKWSPSAVRWQLCKMYGSLSQEREDYIALGLVACAQREMREFEAASSLPRNPVTAILSAETADVDSFFLPPRKLFGMFR